MLGYAIRSVRERRSLWGPAALLGGLAALPGILLVTVLAPAATAFLLTADVRVAAALLPQVAWFWVPTVVVAAGLVWVRAYVILLWASDERKEDSLPAAWRGTSSSWLPALVVYSFAQVLIVALLAALVVMGLVVGPDEIGLIIVFAAVFTGIALRAVVRIALTLTLRGIVLDGHPTRAAWEATRAILRDRRNDVVAAWVALVALGVALWLGGRFITPVLQDTALAYGHSDPRTWLHQGAQLLFAIPLEGFLIAFSAAVWTAVYVGGDLLIERKNEAPSRSDPYLLRLLAGIALLALVVNGIPTLIERAELQEGRARVELLSMREIEPEDARRVAVPVAQPDYDVEAFFDGSQLSWTTTIRWRNDTGETLEDLGFNVYPNAFTRSVEEIPLGADLLQSPVVRGRARSGTFALRSVRLNGQELEGRLRDTALTVPLPQPALAGEPLTVEIELQATLPRWPERYGTWDDMTLLGNWIPSVTVREAGTWRFDDYGSVGDPFVSESASYQVSLSVPAHLGVVGTGILTGVEESQENRTWSFDARYARDAAFAISPFWRGLERRAGDVIVRAWYPADSPLDGADLITDGASSVAHFTQHYGALPIDEVEIVQTNGYLGGMEYPGVVFVSDGRRLLEGFPLLPDLMEHAGFGRAARRYVVGHEVAHQWWYASVGNDQVREPWLDEALAEVSTRLWLRAEEGHDRTWVMTNLSARPEPGPGVISASLEDFESNVDYARTVYLEGSELLLRLRDRIGARAFNAIMRSWHERGRGRVGTITEFLAVVRDLAGPAAAEFLERYRDQPPEPAAGAADPTIRRAASA